MLLKIPIVFPLTIVEKLTSGESPERLHFKRITTAALWQLCIAALIKRLSTNVT